LAHSELRGDLLHCETLPVKPFSDGLALRLAVGLDQLADLARAVGEMLVNAWVSPSWKNSQDHGRLFDCSLRAAWRSAVKPCL
jgi:hypothetical protein